MTKIKIDQPELSDKEILKHKDFNSLKNSLLNTPSGTWHNIKYWVLSGGAAVLATALIFLAIHNKASLPDPPTKQVKPAPKMIKTSVVPPIAEMDLPYESYIIDNTKDTNIHYHTGSIIHIPKYAFRTDKPEQVVINYREFHNPIDIFLSGIPMEYDSAGTKYNFESAGMLDIRAFEDDKPLELNKNIELNVLLASADLKSEFNLYSLNDTTGIWTYKGKDKITPISKPKIDLENTKEQTSDYTYIKDMADEEYSTISRKAPVKRNEKRYAFKLDLDHNQKQRFTNAEDVLFEVRESSEGFDTQYYDIDWEFMNITPREDGDYNLKLTRGSQSFDLIVYPVYSKAKYEAAKKKYHQDLKANQEQKKALLSNRQSKTNQNDDIANLYDNYIKNKLNPKGFRSFSINSMGIHNIDLPNIPSGKLITPALLNQEQKTLNCRFIYVVEKDKNMVSKFTGNRPFIVLNTNKENIIWALTDENKIAIPKQEQVNAITQRSKIPQLFDAEDFQPKEGLQELKKKMNLPLTKKKKAVKLNSKTYPNPCVNEINIELSEEHDCLVQLLDISGKMLDNTAFKGKDYRWDISQHKKGNYIIVVLIPALQYKSTFRIVKQ